MMIKDDLWASSAYNTDIYGRQKMYVVFSVYFVGAMEFNSYYGTFKSLYNAEAYARKLFKGDPYKIKEDVVQ